MSLHAKSSKRILILLAATAVLFTKVNSAHAAASLRLEPELKYISIGETLELEIIMNTDGEQAAGGDVIITYDPEVVSVVDLLPGKLFSDYPSATFDNVAGVAKLSGIVASISELFTGEGVFGRIIVQGKKAGSTELTFDFTPGSTTDSNIAVTYGSGDILAKVSQAIVIVNPTVVTPVVTAPASSADLPIPTSPPQVIQEQPKLSFWDKVAIFLGLKDRPPERPQSDPAAPITSASPNRNPSSEQPEIANSEVVPEETSKPFPWQPILAGLVIIIALMTALVIWRKNKPKNVIINV